MRTPVICSAWAITAALACGQAAAQQPQAPLPPSTVQLPTFSFFTVQTTVSVPDRGAVQLGGITRGRDGRIERGFGPLANRATGGDRSVASTTVHATIIDNDEIDRMLLAAAARRAGTAVDPALGKAAELSRHVATPAPAVAAGRGAELPGSVAAIKVQNAAAAEAQQSEAAELLAKGQAAEAEGKAAIAKVFYQMVVRRDAGQLKQQAAARLAALSSGKPAAVAQR